MLEALLENCRSKESTLRQSYQQLAWGAVLDPCLLISAPMDVCFSVFCWGSLLIKVWVDLQLTFSRNICGNCERWTKLFKDLSAFHTVLPFGITLSCLQISERLISTPRQPPGSLPTVNSRNTCCCRVESFSWARRNRQCPGGQLVAVYNFHWLQEKCGQIAETS